MLAIRGADSSVAQELLKLLPADESVDRIPRGCNATVVAKRYLFCGGVLHSKNTAQQSRDEVDDNYWANCAYIIDECERIIKTNAQARICIIGSESGFAGSYNRNYAAAKAGIHAYVESRQLLSPHQQLVCIAPSIIEDSGMTQRRQDFDILTLRKHTHPKRRFLDSVEVARLVHFLLYVDSGYITNQVIRMNGGEHLK